VPDQQILEVFRDRVRDVDQDLARQVAGRSDRLLHLLVVDRQDHDVGGLEGIGDAAPLRAAADLLGELRGLGGVAPANGDMNALTGEQADEARAHFARSDYCDCHGRVFPAVDL
jgi:hypothetical protein